MIIRAGRQWPKRRRYGIAARHGATSGCPHDARTFDPSGQATLHRAAATASIEIAEPSPRGCLPHPDGGQTTSTANPPAAPGNRSPKVNPCARPAPDRSSRDTTTLHPPARRPANGAPLESSERYVAPLKSSERYVAPLFCALAVLRRICPSAAARECKSLH